MVACSLLAGPNIGFNIGASKGVDGLLRISDQDQALPLVLMIQGVDGFQNEELQRVGVLKFIHQGHRESLANTACKKLPGACLKSLCKVS